MHSRSTTFRPKLERISNRQINEAAYDGLVFAGIVGMSDSFRKNVDKSIRRHMTGGVKLIMIIGDAETTALTTAKRLGMPLSASRSSTPAEYRPVLKGDELDRMSDQNFANAMSGSIIFARTSPEHKLKIIRAFQSRGDVVAMTGDGLTMRLP